jgi:hypothetical protein
MTNHLIVRYDRDELVTLKNTFFPYLIMLYETRYNHAKEIMNYSDDMYLKYLSCKAVMITFSGIRKYIDKRLSANKKNRIELRFSSYTQLVEYYIILSQLQIHKEVNPWFRDHYDMKMEFIRHLLEVHSPV